MRKPATIAFLSALVLAFSVGYALTHRTDMTPLAMASTMDVTGLHVEHTSLPIESWDAF